MFISIDYAGVDEHISEIRLELRYAELLREDLERLRLQAAEDPEALSLIQRCAQEAESVEESIRWRMRFLENLIVEKRQMDIEVGRIVDRVSSEIGAES